MPSIEKVRHLTAQVEDLLNLYKTKDAAMDDLLKLCLKHLKPAVVWTSVDEIKTYAAERKLLVEALEAWTSRSTNNVRGETNAH